VFKYSLLLSGIVVLFSCNQDSTQKAKLRTGQQVSQARTETNPPDISEFRKQDEKIVKEKVSRTIEPDKPKQKEQVVVKESKKPEAKQKTKPISSKPKIVKKPAILFEEPIHDFGEITEGDIIKHKFAFKNTGNAELVVKSAIASCGCTDPSYPFIGIPPGETGYIGVTYNSVSKDGPQKPEVTIKTNADKNPFVLYLTGNVIPKDKEELVKAKKDTLSG